MKIINGKEYQKNTRKISTDNELKIVRDIIKDVQTFGEKAVIKYTEKFDGLNDKPIRLSKSDIRNAYKSIDNNSLEAIKIAAKRIKSFAIKQKKSLKEFTVKEKGIILGQQIIPIERVGCYVPGGNYPLVSSALMTVIPAKVADVKEIILCSLNISDEVIVAADIADADQIFRIGGAQAIAAMAYGTKSIPKVDKIVGPGNVYVTLAKKEVYGEVGIDFIAGPSELLIIADESANPKWIVADLISQAEHGKDSIINLITTSKELPKRINREVSKQLNNLKTTAIANESLRKGKIITVKSMQDAINLSNQIAPEHLELLIGNPGRIVNKLTNYGSMFIGRYSSVVFGDYMVGPNHTLPTSRAARYTGGLSVLDFLKITTFQQVSRRGVTKLRAAEILADIEGLEGHKKTARLRIMKGI